jgi:nucleoid-associated protein YgaU
MRQYAVQAGDTLADISMAFYGTTQHWRVIVNANPGIDPATMAVGTILKIPPKP